MTAHRCTVCGGDLDTGVRCHNPACRPPVTAPASRRLAECPMCRRGQPCATNERMINDALRAAAREALDVLTRLADSAAYWSEYDVPVGIVAEIDEAKARLAGALACEARP